MKIRIYIVALIIISLINTKILKAQQEFIVGDLNPYFKAYVDPFARAMAVSMSGGWNHSAGVHEVFGFDLSISASYVQIPPSDLIFNPTKLKIPGYFFTGKNAPTISSNKTDNLPTITKRFADGLPFGFTMDVIEGLGISFGAMAHIQLGVGLPKGTDLMVKYIPDISGYSIDVIPEELKLKRTGMLGLGLKHNIKQWIPFIKDLPYLEISGMAAYAKFYSGFEGKDMQIDPDMLGIESTLPNDHWDGQHLNIRISSFVGSFLIGGEFPIIQPFIGIGYSSSVFNAAFRGNYPIVRFNLMHLDGIINNSQPNPISTRVVMANKNFQAGARIKLGFFVLHYSILIQEYFLHNAGIAITIH